MALNRTPSTRRAVSGEIKIWRGQGYNHSVYSAAKIDVDKIINAKIFPDGKSIIEVQDEITF